MYDRSLGLFVLLSSRLGFTTCLRDLGLRVSGSRIEVPAALGGYDVQLPLLSACAVCIRDP